VSDRRSDLVEQAERCAERRAGCEAGADVAETFDQVLLQAQDVLHPWQMTAGMRLAGPRRWLLRLLLPFVERQHELNGNLAVLNALLVDEVVRLRARVAELEREAAPEAAE